MAGPAPAPSPGARGALRLAAEAALLLVAGYLVGILAPAGGAEVVPPSRPPPGTARPTAAPAPSPAHPAPSASRPETGATREGTPSSGTAAAPGETSPSAGDAPPLLPGERTTEVLVTVEAPVTFRGVVRHAAKGPLAGVMVSLHRWEGPQNSSARTTSGPGGEFRFESLPAGPWGVYLAGGDFGTSQQVGMVLVPDGGLERDIVVGMVRLSGTVTEKGSSAPIPGVRIGMTTGGVRDPLVTDAAGAYRLLDLAPGLYGFQVSKEGFGIRWIRGVEVPEEGRKFDIEMTPAASLTLHVTKADGGPYAGRLILSAEPKDPEDGTRVSTSVAIDATGTGTCRQVVPGAYTFRIRIPDMGEVAAIEAEVPPAGATLDVRIGGK